MFDALHDRPDPGIDALAQLEADAAAGVVIESHTIWSLGVWFTQTGSATLVASAAPS